MPESKKNQNVFISYSHDSDEHKDRVLALSDRLRADGIDCSIDQYETSPPEGWARWCDRQIEEEGKKLTEEDLISAYREKNYLKSNGISY